MKTLQLKMQLPHHKPNQTQLLSLKFQQNSKNQLKLREEQHRKTAKHNQIIVIMTLTKKMREIKRMTQVLGEMQLAVKVEMDHPSYECFNATMNKSDIAIINTPRTR